MRREKAQVAQTARLKYRWTFLTASLCQGTLDALRELQVCQGLPDKRLAPMIAIVKRKLKCSFCGKSNKEVARLIGGPGVYICDACVSVCNRILEATPIAFPGSQAMTDDQLLSALKIAEATVDATR